MDEAAQTLISRMEGKKVTTSRLLNDEIHRKQLCMCLKMEAYTPDDFK